MVLYGALFLLAGALVPHKGARLLFRSLCVFMIVATGLARVYSGVHWSSDVIGGYLFGLIALAPVFLFYRLAVERMRGRRQA
jgi:undecaprenyl-diphosphatase